MSDVARGGYRPKHAAGGSDRTKNPVRGSGAASRRPRQVHGDLPSVGTRRPRPRRQVGRPTHSRKSVPHRRHLKAALHVAQPSHDISSLVRRSRCNLSFQQFLPAVRRRLAALSNKRICAVQFQVPSAFNIFLLHIFALLGRCLLRVCCQW